MKLFNNSISLNNEVKELKRSSISIGFVPTMGALHDGHISLVKKAKKKADIVVVSIFVNPTQFNDPTDFYKYPRTLDNDVELLKQEGIDILFTPNENEIYPSKDNRNFNFGNLDKVMEGKYRPGHFNGVAQVVSRLFDIVEPDIAIFGEKDFQQLAIIRKMTKDMNYPIEIIGASIIREKDGLAMSSRNRRLNNKERISAGKINQILKSTVNDEGAKSISEIEKQITNQINQTEHLKIEYFSIVNQKTLQPVVSWREDCEKIGCIAVFCGDVRLIDNIKYSL